MAIPVLQVSGAQRGLQLGNVHLCLTYHVEKGRSEPDSNFVLVQNRRPCFGTAAPGVR